MYLLTLHPCLELLMVTPKNIYTVEEKKRFLDNPARILKAYKRDPSRCISLRIRYDPSLKTGFPVDISRYKENGFFLLKQHYDQLQFSIKCLGFPLEISYEEFKALIFELTKDIDGSGGASQSSSYIVEIKFNRMGDVNGTVTATDSVDDFFEGFLEHLFAIKKSHMEAGLASETKLSRPQFYACIDRIPTIPCYSTSFWVDNQSYDEQACSRVREYVKQASESVEIRAPEPVSEFETEDEGTMSDVSEGYYDTLPTKSHCFNKCRKSDECYKIPENEIVPIMYSPAHRVMMCGDWTLCVYRNGKYYTPHISSGCRNDPLRTLLLELGIMHEGLITIQGLMPNEDILLVSSTKGIRRGVVIGDPPPLLYKFRRNRKPRRKPVRGDGGFKQFTVSNIAEASRQLLHNTHSPRNIPNTYVFRVFNRESKGVNK